MSTDFSDFKIDPKVLSALESISKVQNNATMQTIRETAERMRRIMDESIVIPDAVETVKRTAEMLSRTLQPITESYSNTKAFLESARQVTQAIADFQTRSGLTVRKLQDDYAASLQTCIAVTRDLSSSFSALDISGMKRIVESYHTLVAEKSVQDFSLAYETWTEGHTEEDISDEAVADEVKTILTEKKITFSEQWDNIKKATWFKAVKIVLVIILFVFEPVIDKAKDDVRERLGITQFLQESGMLDITGKLLGISEDHSVSEEEAKTTVDESELGNISKQKRDDLLNKIRQIRSFISSAPQDQNTDNLLAYISELEKEVFGKKYGLVYEEHREQIDSVLDSYTPVLTEEEDLFIGNGGQINFLIEGDNLASLQLLEKTHKGRIDLIYIDPPYNTGNKDFVYDDCYVDEEDGFRHSKWSSFLSKRLRIARNLLTEQGIIFIQISDIELAQLRALCDEIFGDENFINIISVNMKNIAGASGGGEDKRLKKNCEYILIYAKNYSIMPIFNGVYVYTELSEMIQQYKDQGVSWKYTSVLLEQGEKEYIGSTVDGDGNEIRVFIRKNPVIKSIKQVAKEDGITEKEAYKKYGTKVFQTTNAQSSIRTRVMEYRKEAGITEDVISIEYVPKTGKNKGQVYEQFYKGDKCRLFVWLKDTSEEIDGELYKRDLQGTYWDFNGSMKNLTKEGNVEFSQGKKPIDLIKRIISMYPQNDITVLDFFAGSGSTGHAVIAQNVEDGGERHFILCTNNQNDICRQKTYVRLSNVINGYTTDTGKVFSPMPASLKYYVVKYISISDRMYYEYADDLLLHTKELVELENGINFTGNAEIAIVLTEEELQDFMENIEDFRKCRKLYMGHDLLPDEEQAAALEEHGIEISIIPDYYYRDLQGD